MTRIYDCTSDSHASESGTSENYQAHIALARSAIGRGALVVIPTDTVYGVAADAFNAEAVQLLLDAGSDPMARDTVGCGALGHIHSGHESEGARNLLLSAGAVACPR